MTTINQFSLGCIKGSVLKITLLILLLFSNYSLAEHGKQVGDVDLFKVRELNDKEFTDILNPNNSHRFRCERLTEYRHAHWTYITYYDNQKSTVYKLKYDGTEYSFVIIQRDPRSSKLSQVWAVSKDYRKGKNPKTDRIAVQITDFIGGHYRDKNNKKIVREAGIEVDDDGELDQRNGVYYFHARETYSEKQKDNTYITGRGISTVMAVNIKKLLKDALKRSVESNRRNYYTQICKLPGQTNIEDCAGGVVYDWESSYLYVALTMDKLGGDPLDGDRPKSNKLYRININHPISFSINTHPFKMRMVGNYKTDRICISHLMINPWDPKYIAIDNYAYSNKKTTPTVDPSALVVFDFHQNINNPTVMHLYIPEALSERNGFSHMSFTGKNSFITSHRGRNRGIFMNFPIVSSPEGGVIYREVRSTQFDVPVGRGVVHSACSRDNRFIVSDMYHHRPKQSRDFDSLFLWYQTANRLFCIPFVDGINESVTYVKGVSTNPHPHASFIDDQNGKNRVIIFNVKHPYDATRVRPEVWQFTIPDAIYNRKDLVPFGYDPVLVHVSSKSKHIYRGKSYSGVQNLNLKQIYGGARSVTTSSANDDLNRDNGLWIVGSSGSRKVWHRQKINNRWRWTDKKSIRINGKNIMAYDIGVGCRHNDIVYAIGEKINNKNIYKYSNGNWSSLQGTATRIDVDANGSPWVVNSSGHVYKLTGRGWSRVNNGNRKKAVDIAAGADGVHFITTDDGQLLKYRMDVDDSWETVPQWIATGKSAHRVDYDFGYLGVTTTDGLVYILDLQTNQTFVKKLPSSRSAEDIAISVNPSQIRYTRGEDAHANEETGKKNSGLVHTSLKKTTFSISRHGLLTISNLNLSDKKGYGEVFDMAGKSVKRFSIVPKLTTCQVDMKSIAQGTYILNIHNGLDNVSKVLTKMSK